LRRVDPISRGAVARPRYALGPAHPADDVTPMKTPVLVVGALMLASCTQETQNQMSRKMQNWTGTDGVLEVYAGDKLVRRFIHIDKLSTAMGTNDDLPRPYRFGYGVLDENLDFKQDSTEAKVYFEISDFGTNYVFFSSPR
jgi:hypothetical protein